MLADSGTVFEFIVDQIAFHRKIYIGINQFSIKLVTYLRNPSNSSTNAAVLSDSSLERINEHI